MNVGKNPKPPEGRYVAEPLVILGEEERSSDISNSFGRNSTSSAKGGSGTNGRAQLDAQQPSQPRTKFVASTFEFEPHSPSEFATDHSRITSFNDLFTTGMPSLDKMLRPNRSSNPACNSDEARKHGISTTNNSLDQTNDGSTVVSRSSNTSKGYSVSLFDNIQLTGANTNSISDAFLSADFNESFKYDRQNEFKIKSSSPAHSKGRSNDRTSPNQGRRSNVRNNSSEIPHGENNDLGREEEHLKDIIRKLNLTKPEMTRAETAEIRLSGVFACSNPLASNNSHDRVTQNKALGDTVHHIYKNPLLECRSNSALASSTGSTQQQEFLTASDRSFLPTEFSREKKVPSVLLDTEKHGGVDFNPGVVLSERSGSENDFKPNSWRYETEHSPKPKPKPLSTLWWNEIAIPFMAKILMGRMWQLVNFFTFFAFVFIPSICMRSFFDRGLKGPTAKVHAVILCVAIILHLLNMVLQGCVLRLIVSHDRNVTFCFAFTMDVLALISPVFFLVIANNFCKMNDSAFSYNGTVLDTNLDNTWIFFRVLFSVSGVAKIIQYDFEGLSLAIVHRCFPYCRNNYKNEQERQIQSENDNRIQFKLRHYKTDFVFENISFDDHTCANGLREEESTKERKSNSAVSGRYLINRESSNSSSLAPQLTSGKSFPTEPGHKKSKIGSILKDRTSMLVGTFILLSTAMSSFFSHAQRPSETNLIRSMLMLHNSLESNSFFAENALRLAKKSTLSTVISVDVNGTCYCFDKDDNPKRESCSCGCEEKPVVTFRMNSTDSMFLTTGVFDQKQVFERLAMEWLMAFLIIVLVWSFVAGRFTEALVVLTVDPMGAMIQLIDILSQNPVGYKNMDIYKQFQKERKEEQVGWSEEVLLGMETNHLMKTIETIANLLEVGFGFAGVEIIRSNLEQGNSKNIYFRQNGKEVLRIFLFCDVRQFTDTTEIMKHEIFFFVNKIAEVVHSICHSLEGAANKNIGDAFLITWSLAEEDPSKQKSSQADKALLSVVRIGIALYNEEFFLDSVSISAKRAFKDKIYDGKGSLIKIGFGLSAGCAVQGSSQADKALLSVVRIGIALYNEEFFLDSVSISAKRAFKDKIYDGKGSLIKIGFGLSAGRAVQGAIGSRKKIDATYISENVDMAETLEGLTKSYKVPLLMSGAFYFFLSGERQMECREVDQIYDNVYEETKTIKIYTWDMDLDNHIKKEEPEKHVHKIKTRRTFAKRLAISDTPKITTKIDVNANQVGSKRSLCPDDFEQGMASTYKCEKLHMKDSLSNGVEMEFNKLSRIRDKFDDSFFDDFNIALQCYRTQDWRRAKKKFQSMISKYDDGPSEYFLQEILKNDCLPPKDFDGYGSI
mmetsp:Transcript_1915/g.3912  ORF Transcript_1915/g.3912 Transcript_1915/m.3912 type:complete len:1351 (-) Transcript_1915:236-4288(-)